MKLFSILDDHIKFEPGGLPPSVAAKFGMIAGLLPPIASFAVGAINSASTIKFSTATVLIAVLGLAGLALLGGAVAVFLSEGRLKHIFYYGVSAPAIILAATTAGDAKANASLLEAKNADFKETNVQQVRRIEELDYRERLMRPDDTSEVPEDFTGEAL